MELQRKLLDELLKHVLQPDEKLQAYNTKSLTAPGENFGSVMLSITLNIQNTKTKQFFEKRYIGKMPLINEFLRKIFKIDISFRKETYMYRDVFPFMNKFYKDRALNDLDIFPKGLGGILNLDESTQQVQSDSIIFMEDIKASGYKTLDKFKGFDEKTAKTILQAIATLHATTVAIKLEDVSAFQKLFLPNLEYVTTYDDNDEIIGMINIAMKYAIMHPKCKAVESKIKENLIKGLDNINTAPKIREPYFTFSHNDLWTNNIMVKDDGTNTKCKLVDFQVASYGSPGKDLVFFLLSSVELSVLRNSLDDLIQYYFDEFTQTLKKLKVDISKFTWNAFLDEIKYSATSTELTHLYIMLKPIFSTADKDKSVDAIKEGSFAREDDITEEYRQRAIDITLIYIEKGWI